MDISLGTLERLLDAHKNIQKNVIDMTSIIKEQQNQIQKMAIRINDMDGKIKGLEDWKNIVNDFNDVNPNFVNIPVIPIVNESPKPVIEEVIIKTEEQTGFKGFTESTFQFGGQGLKYDYNVPIIPRIIEFTSQPTVEEPIINPKHQFSFMLSDTSGRIQWNPTAPLTDWLLSESYTNPRVQYSNNKPFVDTTIFRFQGQKENEIIKK